MSDIQTAPEAPAAAPTPAPAAPTPWKNRDPFANAMGTEEAAAKFDQLLGTAKPPPPAERPRDENGRFQSNSPNPDSEAKPQTNAQPEGADDAAPAESEDAEDAWEIEGEAEGEKIKLTASEIRELALQARKPRPEPAEVPEVVELRKQLESEKTAAQQAREQFSRQLGEYIPLLQNQLNSEFSDIRSMQDLSKLAVEDPARYVRWQHQQQMLNMARAAQRDAEAQSKSEQEAAFQKYVEAESAKLAKADPVFSDPVKGEAEKRAIRDSLKKAGFSDAELAQLTDHRTVLVARKAMLYDKLMASKPSEKRVAQVTRVVRPGTPKQADPRADVRSAALQKLAKTGKLDDAAAAFRALGIR